MLCEFKLKFKRLLSIFKRPKMITHRHQKASPIYVKNNSTQSQIEEYTDNYTPIKRKKTKQ